MCTNLQKRGFCSTVVGKGTLYADFPFDPITLQHRYFQQVSSLWWDIPFCFVEYLSFTARDKLYQFIPLKDQDHLIHC